MASEEGVRTVNVNGVRAAADGCYVAWCKCGWETCHLPGTLESAGEVLRLHVGDKHFDDEGLED